MSSSEQKIKHGCAVLPACHALSVITVCVRMKWSIRELSGAASVHTHTHRLLPDAKQCKIGFTSYTLSHAKITMKGSGVLRERCLSVCRVDESLCWLNTLLHSARICHGDSVADWVVSFEGVIADRAVCLIVPLSLTHLRRIHWCPLTQSCSGRLRGVKGSSFDCLCLSDLMVLSVSCVGVVSASDRKSTDHPHTFTGRLMHITLWYGKYLSKCPIIMADEISRRRGSHELWLLVFSWTGKRFIYLNI